MNAAAGSVKERILEVVVLILGVFVAGEAASALYMALYDPSNQALSLMYRTTPLLQSLFKVGFYCLIVQAAGKKLTDSERLRTGGIISWFEPWRIAQAIAVFGFFLVWGFWVFTQLPKESGMKVESATANPGIFVISGLVVLSSLGWPALFRLMEPKSPFEPGDEPGA